MSDNTASRAERDAAWFVRHWLLLGIAAVSILAFVIPGFGARGGPLRPEITTKAGVAGIFFLQGLALAPAALRAGALRWRLHLITQLFIFLAFPLAVLLLDRFVGAALAPELRFGLLFLAILPTTVSSSVVFTAAARGNVPGALFNAAFANIAGVILTPAWAAILLEVHGQRPPLAPVVAEVAALILLPIVVAQLVRTPLLRVWHPDPQRLAIAANSIILFIVFTAFATSVQSGAFSEVALPALAFVTLLAAGLFAGATAAAAALARLRFFDAGDRRALLFCAPQKTLAAGAPMANILFTTHPALGLILLPLIVYHAVQLLAGAALADRLGRRAAVTPPARP